MLLRLLIKIHFVGINDYADFGYKKTCPLLKYWRGLVFALAFSPFNNTAEVDIHILMTHSLMNAILSNKTRGF